MQFKIPKIILDKFKSVDIITVSAKAPTNPTIPTENTNSGNMDKF